MGILFPVTASCFEDRALRGGILICRGSLDFTIAKILWDWRKVKKRFNYLGH